MRLLPVWYVLYGTIVLSGVTVVLCFLSSSCWLMSRCASVLSESFGTDCQAKRRPWPMINDPHNLTTTRATTTYHTCSTGSHCMYFSRASLLSQHLLLLATKACTGFTVLPTRLPLFHSSLQIPLVRRPHNSILTSLFSTNNESNTAHKMGRGEYYKNKYGGGGRGRGRGRGRGGNQGRGGSYQSSSSNGGGGSNHNPRGGGSFYDLRGLLQQIDNRQYPSYHDLETPMSRGWVNSDAGFTLYIGRAQSDPFAPPTRCKLVVSSNAAQIPQSLYSSPIRATALSDFLLRTLHQNCARMGADASMSGGGQGGWSGPKGGDIQVMAPCQHVLQQSGVTVDSRTGDVTAQLTINLPARGRTVLGQAAAEIFDNILVTLVRQSLYYTSLNANDVKLHVDSVEDQLWLQNQLEAKGLVAFVRNGAILPRASGVNDKPMSSNKAIPFKSPERLEVSFDLPTLQQKISGMGVPKGVTLICGGGFHGKSTLLQALQLGVYCKIPGDGREFCATNPNAIKIRAEDGRCVTSVDISPFINNLPFGTTTTNFSTPDASGSTSQASNIVEVRSYCMCVLNDWKEGEDLELQVLLLWHS